MAVCVHHLALTGSLRDPWQNDDDTKSQLQLKLYFLDRFLVPRSLEVSREGKKKSV